MTTVEDMEREAQEFHAAHAMDAIEIWIDGYNILLRGFDALNGYQFGDRPEQRVMAALFVQTLNSLHCAFDTAMRGFYVQALNLVRPVLEDWMAYWYLRNCPEGHTRFTSPGQTTPTFNDMLQAVESRQNRIRRAAGEPDQAPDQGVRDWMNEQHQFSHVSRIRVTSAMHVYEDFTQYNLGPDQNEVAFRAAVSQMLPIMMAQLEALDNFSQLAHREQVSDLLRFGDRVHQWQNEQQVVVQRLIDKDPSLAP